MANRRPNVALGRSYVVADVSQARSIALGWLRSVGLENSVSFGLPEVDDRYHVWRVPLIRQGSKERLGEVVIEARTSLINKSESTEKSILESRLLGKSPESPVSIDGGDRQPLLSWVRETIFFDDCERALPDSFAGMGTTGAAAASLGRKFVLVENEEKYVNVMRKLVVKWLGKDADRVLCVNCDPPDTSHVLPFPGKSSQEDPRRDYSDEPEPVAAVASQRTCREV